MSTDAVRAADVDDPARLSRALAAAAAPLRAGSSGRAGAAQSRRATCALTIDARLQLRVARSSSSTPEGPQAGTAAAVVLDPDTGDLLASVSYPWPARDRATAERRRQRRAESLLDRARYGLYPPGSTFKLVTAAAALRQDIGAGATTFTCTRLPDGRVGAQDSRAGSDRSATTCSTRIRTGRSTCTTASSSRATPTSRSWRSRSARSRLLDTAAPRRHLA